MTPTLPSIVTSVGLACDIVGALFVANEVVRVFNGPTTIDVGDAGCLNGSPRLVPNPKFEAHEAKKRKIMTWGLGLLLVGFLLQGVGAWLPYLSPQSSAPPVQANAESDTNKGHEKQ